MGSNVGTVQRQREELEAAVRTAESLVGGSMSSGAAAEEEIAALFDLVDKAQVRISELVTMEERLLVVEEERRQAKEMDDGWMDGKERAAAREKNTHHARKKW